MDIRTLALGLAVVACTLPASTRAADPSTSGALATPANRIVGLWTGVGIVRPCGTTLPERTVRNTLLFQAGGTVVEAPRFPPDGAPNVYGIAGTNQRTQGLGTWSYNPTTGQYNIRLRFDWYVDDVYHGYHVVERNAAMLSNGASELSGDVHAVRYRADGSVVAQECGIGISTRQ